MLKLFFAATALSSRVEKARLESLLQSLGAQIGIAGNVGAAGKRALIMTILRSEMMPDQYDPLLGHALISNIGMAAGGSSWEKIALLRRERVKLQISQLDIEIAAREAEIARLEELLMILA